MRSTLVLLVVIGIGCSKGSGPEPLSPTEKLAAQVEQERRLSAGAVEGYAPKVEGRIDELDTPAANSQV